MKSLIKSITLAGLLFTASMSIYAKTPKDALNATLVENVVDAYINSTVKGNTAYINQLFDDNFVQRFQTNHKQAPVSKAAYLKHLKSQEGVTFNCDSDFEVIEKSNYYSIAKVTLNFDNFTRVDYVSLQLEDSGWKIKEVNSVFENK